MSTLHVFNIRGYPSLWASGNWAIWASHAVGIGAFALAAAVAWQIRNQLTRNSPYHRTDRVLVGLTILNCLGIVAVPLGFYSSVAWINLASVLISDCIAIVVSEETGGISVAIKGTFQLRLSAEKLENILSKEMSL